jgi:nucleotide-binding universal stress UspA family protein
MKILCGTDFSVHANEAADVAAAWAARSNAPLKLVHALETARLDFLSQKDVNHLRVKLGRKLTAKGHRLRTAGAEVIESLVLGRPNDVLTASAKQFKAGLIVVSSLGNVPPVRWLVGSVAERTAQNATVPTLVVREHKCLIDWTKGKRPLNIFVGHDFSETSDAVLRWVESLKKIGPCNITVAFSAWPPAAAWRMGIADQPSLAENPPEVQQLLERDLTEKCALLLGKGKVKIRVASTWGRPETQLIELATAGAADLMVVGTNRRSGLERWWLGSVSRGILHHAPMNVACVPLPDERDRHVERIPTCRRVLAPTDFSKLGNRAVAFAYGAVRRGGEVCLVHVLPPAGGFRRGIAEREERQAKRIKDLAARLQALVPEDALTRGIRSRVEVVEHSYPAMAICQAGERFGVDLICLGSRGHSSLKKKLLGSVTEAVLRRSKRPVMVIRADLNNVNERKLL